MKQRLNQFTKEQRINLAKEAIAHPELTYLQIANLYDVKGTDHAKEMYVSNCRIAYLKPSVTGKVKHRSTNLHDNTIKCAVENPTMSFADIAKRYAISETTVRNAFLAYCKSMPDATAANKLLSAHAYRYRRPVTEANQIQQIQDAKITPFDNRTNIYDHREQRLEDLLHDSKMMLFTTEHDTITDILTNQNVSMYVASYSVNETTLYYNARSGQLTNNVEHATIYFLCEKEVTADMLNAMAESLSKEFMGIKPKMLSVYASYELAPVKVSD